MGSRKDRVFPEPVCDCMNTSLDEVSSSRLDRREGSAARWMDVGFEILILFCR